MQKRELQFLQPSPNLVYRRTKGRIFTHSAEQPFPCSIPGVIIPASTPTLICHFNNSRKRNMGDWGNPQMNVSSKL